MISRRALLGSGLLVLAAGGGGVAVAYGRPPHRAPTPVPDHPAWLTAAIDRELALLTGLDDATPIRAAVRADHLAHLAALRALLPPALPGPPADTPRPAPARPVAELRAAETNAAAAAVTASMALIGADATLLGSIAACEAGHVELLS